MLKEVHDNFAPVKPTKIFKMMKRAILVIIMMISTLGLYSFKYNTNDAKQVLHRSTTINLTVEKPQAVKFLIIQN